MGLVDYSVEQVSSHWDACGRGGKTLAHFMLKTWALIICREDMLMKFKKIALASIVLGISLACVGCQTPNWQNSNLGRSSQNTAFDYGEVNPPPPDQAVPRFIEQQDPDHYVANQLRREATNLSGYNRKS